MIKAALFDLDGVVFDTESQYSIFWGMIGRSIIRKCPISNIASKDRLWFRFTTSISPMKPSSPTSKVLQAQRRNRLKLQPDWMSLKRTCSYEYIAGFEDFISDLKQHGVKCAVVTSSNIQKMLNVYDRHPEFKAYFDRVLTSEDFAESKPHPDCYLKGSSLFRCRTGGLCRTGRQL